MSWSPSPPNKIEIRFGLFERPRIVEWVVVEARQAAILVKTPGGSLWMPNSRWLREGLPLTQQSGCRTAEECDAAVARVVAFLEALLEGRPGRARPAAARCPWQHRKESPRSSWSPQWWLQLPRSADPREDGAFFPAGKAGRRYLDHSPLARREGHPTTWGAGRMVKLWRGLAAVEGELQAAADLAGQM